MSNPFETLDTIDAVAGHQRTGNGKQTIRNLTAELREVFEYLDDERRETSTAVADEIEFAQDIPESELQYADLSQGDPREEAFNEAEAVGEESFLQDVADAGEQEPGASEGFDVGSCDVTEPEINTDG